MAVMEVRDVMSPRHREILLIAGREEMEVSGFLVEM